MSVEMIFQTCEKPPTIILSEGSPCSSSPFTWALRWAFTRGFFLIDSPKNEDSWLPNQPHPYPLLLHLSHRGWQCHTWVWIAIVLKRIMVGLYQAGISIPPLMVTGKLGAVGQMTWWSNMKLLMMHSAQSAVHTFLPTVFLLFSFFFAHCQLGLSQLLWLYSNLNQLSILFSPLPVLHPNIRAHQ